MKITAMEQAESVSDVLCDVCGASTRVEGVDCNLARFAPVGAMARPMMASAMRSICASPAFSARSQASDATAW